MVGGTTFFVLCCLSVICPSSIHFQIYSYILLCNNMMCHSFIWQTVVDREKIVSSCKVISSQYYNLSHGNNYGKSKCNLRLKRKALTTKCFYPWQQKVSFLVVKVPKFYNNTFKKNLLYTFFLKSGAKDIINFTIGLQTKMSPITKNNLKIHKLACWSSSIRVIVISYCKHFVVLLTFSFFIFNKGSKIQV